MPRLLEYRLTNSAASRAYLLTPAGCSVDDVGDEALLVLHFHRVERAAVGIDADEKIVLGCDFEHASSSRVRANVW